jgi:hypothetical protein
MIIDEVAANGNAHTIWVILLGAVVDIYDGIFGDVPGFIMCEIENCIGANGDTFSPLGKAM